jgi:hypothetical protein
MAPMIRLPVGKNPENGAVIDARQARAEAPLVTLLDMLGIDGG